MNLEAFTEKLDSEQINYKKDEIMKSHTTFRIGGKADVFVVPQNRNELTVLLNTAKENGVPVLCLGGKACDLVGTILIHGAGYSSVYSMLYKLNEGYQEPFLDAKAVAAGGMDFAEELVGKLCTYFKTAEMNKYIEASERWSAAISSVDEAATAVTTTTETTSEPSVSETPETTESHRIAMESK